VDIRQMKELGNRDLAERLSTVKDPAMANVLDGLYTSQRARKGGDVVGRALAESVLVNDIKQQASAAGLAGREDTPEHAALVSRAVAGAERAGDTEAALAIAEAFGAPAGQSWSEHVAEKHPFLTEKQTEEYIEKIKKGGAGASPGYLKDLYDQLAGAPGGGEMEGGAVAFTPADLDGAIKRMNDAADDLARMRESAMADVGKKRFPRSNWLITSPNQYTDPAELRRLGAWGVYDPGYVQEVATELERHPRALSPWKAAEKGIAARGGLSSERPADEALSEGYETATREIDEMRAAGMSPGEFKQWVNDYGTANAGDDARGRGVLLAVNAAAEGLRDVEPDVDLRTGADKKASADRRRGRDNAQIWLDDIRQRSTTREDASAQVDAKIRAHQGDDAYATAVRDTLMGAGESYPSGRTGIDPLGGKLSSRRERDVPLPGSVLAVTPPEGDRGRRATMADVEAAVEAVPLPGGGKVTGAERAEMEKATRDVDFDVDVDELLGMGADIQRLDVKISEHPHEQFDIDEAAFLDFATPAPRASDYMGLAPPQAERDKTRAALAAGGVR
jgi:hypothetical protein